MKPFTDSHKKIRNYIHKAMRDFRMIQTGDRVLVCLSGGKDSFTLLTLLRELQIRSHNKFFIFSYTLDQSQPGWVDDALHAWLKIRHIPYEIVTRDTYSIVKEKVPPHKTYCSLCSRLRRGHIYEYARKHGFNKIALGHHRDDIIETFLMSILYSGQTKAMPPKYLTDDQQHIIIRPMAYVQESDIIQFSKEQSFPIIPCNLCGSQDNLTRQQVKHLIETLAQHNPKVPSNILSAISNIRTSQLMDQEIWDFKGLEQKCQTQPQDSAFTILPPLMPSDEK